MWIYVLGERTGRDVKIGHTKYGTVAERIYDVDRRHANGDSYVLLAAMLGTTTAETTTQRYFEDMGLRLLKGKDTEYFKVAPELLEWIAWLRQQWWTCFDDQTHQDDWVEQHHSDWLPSPSRRVALPPDDPSKIVQDHEQLSGPLAGTAWSLLPDPLASFNDYFTPPEIIAQALEAMDSVDLDAASHWIANRRLHDHGVAVGTYFTVNYSAFEHDWNGNVWLNPPYGQNERWFTRAIQMLDEGKTAQLCFLSPVYVFTTRLAQEFMQRVDAMVLLSPTPKFYNPAYPNGRDPVTGKSKDGTNLPHAICYSGPRVDEFLAAFRSYGIPITIAWDRLPAEVSP